jgi:hypothetical protein
VVVVRGWGEKREWVRRIAEDLEEGKGRRFGVEEVVGDIYTDALGSLGWCAVVVREGEKGGR